MTIIHFKKSLGKYCKGINRDYPHIVIFEFVLPMKGELTKWNKKITKHIPENILYELNFKGETNIDLIVYGDKQQYNERQIKMTEEHKHRYDHLSMESLLEEETLKWDTILKEYIYQVNISSKVNGIGFSSSYSRCINEEQKKRRESIKEEMQLKAWEEARKRQEAKKNWIEEGIQKYKDDHELIRKEQMDYWNEYLNKKRQTKKEFGERVDRIGIRITNLSKMPVKYMKEKMIPKITEDLKTKEFSENTMKWWFNQNNIFEEEE